MVLGDVLCHPEGLVGSEGKTILGRGLEQIPNTERAGAGRMGTARRGAVLPTCTPYDAPCVIFSTDFCP